MYGGVVWVGGLEEEDGMVPIHTTGTTFAQLKCHPYGYHLLGLPL